MSNHISLITKYFPTLTDTQREQFASLQGLYEEWNAKINVISRKDIGELMLHHVLHSLAIAKFTDFKAGTRIIDVGTGGGFPGIPLAIVYPEVSFTLVDSIGKKIKVCEEVAKALGLNNVRAMKARSEEIHEKFDFITSRGVTTLPEFAKMTRHLIDRNSQNAIMNGIIYLKGGDLTAELRPFGRAQMTCPISDYFAEEYFQEKSVVYVSI